MGTTGQSITLANSIIGVGILAMPFCFQQCGVLLATVILLFMGLVSRLCCYFLLKSALLARRRNFEFLAFHVFGPAGKLAVEIGIIGFLMGTCIAYFVVVGDLGPQIVAKMFNINQSDILRTSIMVIVSLVCVLPLGLLRNVDSLSNVSAATIGFYFCLVMKVITEALSRMFAGDWKSCVELWRPAGLLQCVPIFSMALFCQTQLFEIFEFLPSLSLEKMNVVTKNAINICAAVYFTLGLFGYIAFGAQNISGNILMSLSETMASDVIKLGFVMSVAFSFPLIIFPCRASLYSLLYKKVHSSHHDHIINNSIPERSFRCITVAIIAVSLFISLLIPNIELVLGFVGSTIGVLICVVFPAACFVNVTVKNTNERLLAKGILVLGLVIMVLGTYANLQAAESQVDKYDEKMTEERIDKIVQDFFHNKERSEPNLKPVVKNVAIAAPQEVIKVDDEGKDSKIQPPNPVPPESHSNEKLKIKPIDDNDINNKDVLAPKVPPVQEDSDSHPRNLQPKLDEAKLKSGNLTQNDVPQKVVKEAISLQDKVRDQVDYMKQQQLIETIKQHDLEQKELIKEQIEILDKIKKTKDELQQETKKEANDEAKKIAVESIQKIANIAIQSLNAVPRKPDIGADNLKNDEKKLEPLKVIADEAVQEIVKQAAESLQAIKETNEVQASKEKLKDLANKNTADIKGDDINVVNDQNANKNILPVPNIVDSRPSINDANALDNSAVNKNAKHHNFNAQSLPNILNGINTLQVKAEGLPRNDKIAQDLSNSNVMPPSNVNQNPLPIQSNVDQILEAPNNVQSNKQADENFEVPNRNILASRNAQNRDAHDNYENAIPNIEPGNVEGKENNKQKLQNAVNVQSQSSLLNNQVKPESGVASNQIIPNLEVNSQKNIHAQNQVKENIQVNQANEKAPQMQIGDKVKHYHSDDEPQSYKQGEELIKSIPINVPLAVAMNGNSQINEELYKNHKSKQDEGPKTVEKDNANVQNNHKLLNVADNDVINPIPRQKREVIDCTEKTALQPKNKEICEKLRNNAEQLISEQDLNGVILSNKLPSDVHRVRSLKSYDETASNLLSPSV